MKSRTYFRIAAVTLAVVFTGWMAVRVINAAEPQPIKKKAAVSQTVDPSDPTSVIYLDTSGKLAAPETPRNLSARLSRPDRRGIRRP